jgi:hypothetical protein
MANPKPPQGAAVEGLAPFVHVADVERSLAFYEQLGLVRQGTHAEGGRTVWGSMRNCQAHIMFAQADPPIVEELQGVLFYLYSKDVRALRAHLVACGLRDASGPPEPGVLAHGAVFPIRFPFYMPAGELRVHDPDGYCLLIGQLE